MSDFREVDRYEFPVAGTIRLHPDPTWIPGTTSAARPPRHRFDDPEGGPRGFAVRYTASTLRGSLLECLAQFRPSPEALALEEAVEHGDDFAPSPDEEASFAVRDFLAAVRVGRCKVVDPSECVSIHDPRLQAELDTRDRVRSTLTTPPARSALGSNAHLDEALVRLGGPLGRPITQACAREIYEAQPRVAGIHHLSRHDDDEPCWAIFHDANVDFPEIESLDPTLRPHREAVQRVLAMWGIAAPQAWK